MKLPLGWLLTYCLRQIVNEFFHCLFYGYCSFFSSLPVTCLS
uniref:Uncharacterized protein n=1 Tax=Rhizophora mucronata TaxID=61149 RepID=A0A2P2QUW5_RHIMU